MPASSFRYKKLLTVGFLFVVLALFALIQGPTIASALRVNASVTASAKSIDEEMQYLNSFDTNTSAIDIPSFKNRQQALLKEQQDNPFSVALIDSYSQLFNDIMTAKETLITANYEKLSAKVLKNRTKLEQITAFGADTSVKQEELQSIEERVNNAETNEDFVVAEQLLDQLDFFLQNVINTKKTLYLQEHLASQLDEVKNLIQEGKKIGVLDKEFEDLVASITVSHVSSQYLFQLEKYESILIDKKLVFAERVAKKKEELLQQQLANTYIATKSPTKFYTGKYIEVSISEQVVRMYENGEQINSDFIVSGKNGWTTTPGLHTIWLKRASFRMQGNLRGEEWDVWTNYATFFTKSGEALHDSPWRKRFGPKANRAFNGSHGCINMTTSMAKFVYNWSEIGTPVFINYD